MRSPSSVQLGAAILIPLQAIVSQMTFQVLAIALNLGLSYRAEVADQKLP